MTPTPNPSLPQTSPSGPAITAFGGGHGLAASLSALRLISSDLTAVVTVADDGGSSGRLREELNVLPPGDLRMALAALCDDTEWGRTWRDMLQYRFSTNGSLDQHAVGNILLVAMWQILGDSVEGLDWIGQLLGSRGRVLPMAAVPLDIEAEVSGLHAEDPTQCETVRGQSAVATTVGRIESVRLIPDDPPVVDEVIEAIERADWVVLGPGSWFTSVIPHLLVTELSGTLLRTNARRCITLNLDPQTGETDGFSAIDHLSAFQRHAPDLRIDAVLADPASVDDVDELIELTQSMGGHLMLRQVRIGEGIARHDPLRLAAAYRDIFDGAYGDVE